ncbi:MAG: 30S ribosomal protein S8 [Patescibacteria group bacterium]|nr:30S ribosomal protein S8 [Patescibacteria group bacterium]
MTSGFDPILSMLSEIKNAAFSGHKNLEVGYSRYRESVLKILKKMGLLDFKVIKMEGQIFKGINIELSEDKEALRRFKSYRSFSRPGRRVYSGLPQLKSLVAKKKYGLVLSTSLGVMEIREALKRSLGGELLFEI